MKHQIRHTFILILALVTTLVAAALVLSTNNFQEQKDTLDFGVSSDFCGSDGRGGDSPNCNIGDTQCINGQTWSCVAYSANCNCPQGCRGFQQFVSNTCAGNPEPTPDPVPVPNPPPTGNNPTRCSNSAPTASVCRGAAPGTYVAGADCTCTFNGGAGSNLCGCVPNNTPEPDPEEPDMSIPDTPTQPSGEVGDNSDNNNANVVRVCGRNVTDRSGGVCNGVQVGKLTSSNCRCNNSCYCLPTGTGGAGDACLSDDSCAGSLVCRKQNDGSGFKCVTVQQAQQSLIDNFNTVTDLIDEKNETAQQNSDTQDAGNPVQCGFGKCKPGYECVDKKKQLCQIPETGSGEVGDSDDGVKLPPQFALPDKLEVGPKPTKEDWNDTLFREDPGFGDANIPYVAEKEDLCYFDPETGFREKVYLWGLVDYAKRNNLSNVTWEDYYSSEEGSVNSYQYDNSTSCQGAVPIPEVNLSDLCYFDHDDIVRGFTFEEMNNYNSDINRIVSDIEEDGWPWTSCQIQVVNFCSTYENLVNVPILPERGDLLQNLEILGYNQEDIYKLLENQYICES